jgi:hypothetical protein
MSRVDHDSIIFDADIEVLEGKAEPNKVDRIPSLKVRLLLEVGDRVLARETPEVE